MKITVDVKDATTHQLLKALLERQEEQMAISARLEAALTDLQSDVAKVVAVLETFKQTVTTLQTQLEATTLDRDALKATVGQLEAQAATVDDEMLMRLGRIDTTLEAELPPPTP